MIRSQISSPITTIADLLFLQDQAFESISSFKVSVEELTDEK